MWIAGTEFVCLRSMASRKKNHPSWGSVMIYFVLGLLLISLSVFTIFYFHFYLVGVLGFPLGGWLFLKGREKLIIKIVLDSFL